MKPFLEALDSLRDGAGAPSVEHVLKNVAPAWHAQVGAPATEPATAPPHARRASTSSPRTSLSHASPAEAPASPPK